MPFGLSKAKTKINRMLGNKSGQQDESQSTGDDQGARSKPSASAADSNSLSPISPTGAPQLAHPNISSTRVNQQKDGADDEQDEEEDMTAAVLSAGNQTKTGSQIHGKSSSDMRKENEIPQQETTLGAEAGKESQAIPEVATSESAISPGTAAAEDSRPVGTLEAHTTPETSSSLPPPTDPATHARNISVSSELSASEPRLGTGSEPTTSQNQPTATKSEASRHDDADVPAEDSKGISETAAAQSESSKVDDGATSPAQTGPQHSGAPASEIGPTDKEQEIDDIEKREAQAAVEASRAPASESAGKEDLAVSKGTSDVIKSVAANAGAAGHSMGMSATSGPMEDMPAA